uniref:AB hydrolase-1 domain-containing protein n=1 Tax=Chenopodium quinoa TaxID=63459 RepID=A0A803KSG4_CHEQI
MQHFVLVHGTCHGAWCWHKLIPLLRRAGRQVTAVDLGGCGVYARPLSEIVTIDDYVEPLMDVMRSINPHDDGGDEKVVLVGHSFGGIAISMAMEKFPEKILVSVFLSAYMPNCSSPPLTLVQETFKRTPLEGLLDTKFRFDNGPEKAATHAMFGPKMLSTKLYQNCQPEDIELAKKMVKLDGLFSEDLAKDSLFSEKRFGRVKRVFVISEEDESVKTDFQKWIIENSPPHQVKSIPKADHMGAWCWYKLIPLLENAGHRVTALDMAGSGANTKRIEDVHIFEDLGGMNIAFAMESFPQKTSAAVFLAAVIPDTIHQPSYVLNKFAESIPEEAKYDTKFWTYGSPEEPLTATLFGPQFVQFLASLSPTEDYELAVSRQKPSSLFLPDLTKAKKFSNNGFESVRRIYVISKEDKVLAEEFARWMIENSGVQEIREVQGADHVTMLSKRHLLCDCLLDIARVY